MGLLVPTRSKRRLASLPLESLYAKPQITRGDTCNRADSAISPGSTDLGFLGAQVWTQEVGTWGILSGYIYPVGIGGNSRANFDCGLADGVFEWTCKSYGGITKPYTALAHQMFRYIDGSNFWCFAYEGNFINLYKRVAGTFTTVVAIDGRTSSFAQNMGIFPEGSIANGVDYIYTVVANGPVIQCYVNGFLVISYTMTAAEYLPFKNATRIGCHVGTVASSPPDTALGWKNITARPLSDLYLLDTFNRADGAVGSADTGQAWTVVQGTPAIASSVLTFSTDTNGDRIITNLGVTDVLISCSLTGTLTSGTDRRMISPVFRCSDVNVTDYLFLYSTTGGAIVLNKSVGGSTSVLASAAAGMTVDGQMYNVVVSCRGNTITVYVDGVAKITHVLSGSDTAFAGYTWYGARLVKLGAPATAAVMDNLVIRKALNASILSTTDSELKIVRNPFGLGFAGGKATPAWDDPRISPSRPHKVRAGLTFECELQFSSFGTGGSGTGASGIEFGFDTVTPVTQSIIPGFYVNGVGTLLATGAVYVALPITIAIGKIYRFRIVMTNPGAIWLISLNQGRTWIPVWQVSTGFQGTYYEGFSNKDAVVLIRYRKVFQGSSPQFAFVDNFNRATLIGNDMGKEWLVIGGTAALNGSDIRAATTTAFNAWNPSAGVSDGIIEAAINFGSAPSTSKEIRLRFRVNNANSGAYYDILINRVAQTILLSKNVGAYGGTSTSLSTVSAAGFVDNTTYVFRIVLIGTGIAIYQDGVVKISTTDQALRYAVGVGLRISDNLATPDARIDYIRAWGFPRQPALKDAFDRPDSAVALGRPETGQSYTLIQDNAGGATIPTWGIIGNKAYPANRVSGQNRLLAVAPLNLLSFVARVKVTIPASGIRVGVVLRFVDYQNWVDLTLRLAANQLRLAKDIAGTVTEPTGAAIAVVAGSEYEITAVVLGNILQSSVDGALILSATLTDFPGSNIGGIAASSLDAAATHNDLVIQAMTNPYTIHDSFTKTDSATAINVAETGETYVLTSDLAGTPVWGISSGQAYLVTAVASSADNLAVLPCGMADCLIENFVTIAASATLGITFRYVDSSNYLAARLTQAGSFTLIQNLAGVRTTLATVSLTISAATQYGLRIVMQGTTIKVYFNNALILTQVVTNFSTATWHGLYSAAGSIGTSNKHDNLRITEDIYS